MWKCRQSQEGGEESVLGVGYTEYGVEIEDPIRFQHGNIMSLIVGGSFTPNALVLKDIYRPNPLMIKLLGRSHS
jgi:hypothetical protein